MTEKENQILHERDEPLSQKDETALYAEFS
jgi:hypothetical protein